MRFRSARILQVCVVAAVAGSAFAAERGFRFGYRLEPGATYDQVVTMDMTLKMGTGAAAPAIPGLDQPISQKTRIEVSTSVGEKDAGGSTPLEIRAGRAEATLVVAGQSVTIPVLSGGGEAPVVHARLGSDGRVVEIDPGAGGDLPPGTAERLLGAMPAFPDRRLSVGDTFEIPMQTSLPVPLGAGDLDLEGTAAYTLESVEGGQARFAIRQSFSAATKTGAAAGFGMEMSGGGVGTGTFDLKEGIFTAIRIEMSLKVAMRAGAPAGQAAAPEAGGVAPPVPGVQVEAQGPVEFTMSRRRSTP